MNKIKKSMMAAAILFGTCAAPLAAFNAIGQEAGGLTDAQGNAVSSNAAARAGSSVSSSSSAVSALPIRPAALMRGPS